MCVKKGRLFNRHINNKRLNKYKIISFILIFILIFSNLSFANLEDDEEINLDEIQNEVIETSKIITDEPKINSRIALVYDRKSGNVIYEKNGYKTTPMASTTKIMSSIIVLENGNLNDVVTIDKKAAGTGGSRLGLKTGDKVTVNDLLYGLMLRSGNDAAVALAIHIGGSVDGFARLMNQKAKELGLHNTNFVTPHGLDNKNHYTSAYELACMANYALKNKKFVKIVGTKSCNITINGVSRTISNTNELLGNLNGVYGIKTGFTNGAGRCLVTACKRNNLDIITVVLGADTKKIRTSDSIKIIEYINKNYSILNTENIIKEQFENWKLLNEKRIQINKGVLNNLTLELDEIINKEMAVENTNIDNINININCLYYLEAPVKKNDIVGTVEVKLKNNVIEIRNIVNKIEIRKKNIRDYFKEFLQLIP